MLEDDPLGVQAAELLRRAQEVRAAELVAAAEAFRQAKDDAHEEASLREAAAVAPVEMETPRRTLAAHLQRRAGELDRSADSLNRAEDSEGALNALLAAQSLSPDAARSGRIRALQIEVEFEAGMRAYNVKQYVQAVFQFKKVLRLDSAHADARRYLEFARRFSTESTTDSLQDRFSKLE
jgi:tetratricopeptide (TPR) repeat protein